MWPNFVHLFWRIIHGMPVLVSSNWAAWILGGLTFAFTEAVLYMTTSPLERVKRLRLNLLIGLAVTTFGYSILFVWSSIQTVYDNHHNTVGRWQTVLKEKDNLKTELKQRDDYIKRLEAKSCPTCPSSRHSNPQPSQVSSAPETINDVLAEVRITCTLKDPQKMPMDASFQLPMEDSYLKGATGKSYLQSRATHYQRGEEDGKVLATENFKASPNSDLIGRPVSTLADYPILHVIASSVAERELSTCVFVEVTLRVNGNDVFRKAEPISFKVDGEHSITFDAKLDGMKLPK